MPERDVSPTNLAIGAHLTGWILTGWSVLMTTLMVFFIDHTTLGTQLRTLGMPQWLIIAPMLTLTALQLGGHLTHSRATLVAGSVLGAFLCLMGAAIVGYATLHGDDSAGGVINWTLAGSMFMVDMSILRQRQ